MTNQEKAAKLREARALIDTPEKWWDGQTNQPVAYWTARACAIEATWRVCDDSEPLDVELVHTLELVHMLEPDERVPVAHVGRVISNYNDTHTHAEVLDLFDKTIARLEAL